MTYCFSTIVAESGVWGSLALMTLLESDEAKIKHLARLVVKLLSRGVALPGELERVCMVKLLREKRSEATDIFGLARTYARTRRVLPPKV